MVDECGVDAVALVSFTLALLTRHLVGSGKELNGINGGLSLIFYESGLLRRVGLVDVRRNSFGFKLALLLLIRRRGMLVVDVVNCLLSSVELLL